MDGEIAWTRFLIYIGISILLLSEIYRLMLFLSQVIIYAPVLFAFLQNFVQLGFLIGFFILFIGFLRFKRSYLTITNLTVSSTHLALIIWLSGLLVICSIFLSLLPPVSLTASGSLYTLYSIFISFFWMFFYTIFLFWVSSYWNLIENPLSTNSIFKNKFKWTHVLFITLVSLFWFFETFSLILQTSNLLNNSIINGMYVILFLLYIIFQIWFYFKMRTFAFRIIG